MRPSGQFKTFFLTKWFHTYKKLLFYYNLWHYLYENKPAYELHHLTYIFYCQSMTKVFSQFHKFPNLCFSLWILLILSLDIFLLNKTSLNLLNSVAILTPFAVLHSLPSIFIIEYIFGFYPINSSTVTAKFIFHFTNNVFISWIRKLFRIFWVITKVK